MHQFLKINAGNSLSVATAAFNQCPMRNRPNGLRDPSCITDQQTIMATVLDHPSSPRTQISSKFSCAFKELKNPYQFRNG